MPELRKYNRRWVTDHVERITLDATSLDALLEKATDSRSHFVPGSFVMVRHGSFGDFGIVLTGIRYATPEELRQRNEQERVHKARVAAERRRRVQAALDVLNQEAPHVLNRTDVRAEDLLEENAV